MARKILTLIEPKIERTIVWNGSDWIGTDGEKAIIDPILEFEVVDEVQPDLVHYICKFGYKVSEEDGKMTVLRLGFIEYAKESTSIMA